MDNDTNASAAPGTLRADVRQVAAFRLPVSVKSLCAMVDGLTREYGKGLTMRQVGDSLIIEQPNAALTGAESVPSNGVVGESERGKEC